MISTVAAALTAASANCRTVGSRAIICCIGNSELIPNAGQKHGIRSDGSVLIWILALVCFLFQSVQIVKGVAKPRLFGTRVGQEDAKLRFPVIPKNIVVFQYPVVIQVKGSLLDVLILREQSLKSLFLGNSECFRRYFLAHDLPISALRCYRLSGSKNELFDFFWWWTSNWNGRCYEHPRRLHIASRSSSAVKEYHRDCPGLGFCKTFDVIDAENSNPGALFIPERGLSIPNRGSRIFGGGLQLIYGTGNATVDFFGAVRKIVSGINLITSGGRHGGGGIGLISRRHSEFMSINPLVFTGTPLENSGSERCERRHNQCSG